MVDYFDREATQRHIYQLYQAKVHPMLAMLQVRNLSFVALDVGNLYYSTWVTESAVRAFTFLWQAVITAEVAD